MDPNRAAHLANLMRDIDRWQAEVIRLEKEGRIARADAIRGWIKSAERLAERLKRPCFN